VKTRKSFWSAGIFFSALCILTFTCKSPADNTQPGGKAPVLVEEITINEGNITLKTGDTASLTVTVSPANAANKDVTWESSDLQKVTLNPTTGGIKALGEGTAVITATAQDGSGVQGAVSVTITATGAPPVLVTGVTVLGGNFSLAEEETRTLSASVLPANAADKTLRWSSSAPAVAEVGPETGKVAAKTQGTAVITAAAQDGSGKSGAVTVTVTPPLNPSDYMTPQEIFAALKGQKITTNGWADRANSGAGLSYANPASLTLIDDASYPTAVAKRMAFTNAINSNNEKFIIVSGDIDLGDGVINNGDKSYFDQFNSAAPYGRLHADIRFDILSNTTIIGVNNARFMFGSLRINNRQNVIIRNVIFWDAHGSTENDTSKPGYEESKASIDALVVQGDSNGVWVDHCKFTDGTCNDMLRNYNHDGAFDIPKGKNITVSWCEFTNHDKVMLVAGSDSAANAVAEDRQITLHHNYFHGTTQRMPRTRGTQMHVYNNYYNDIGVPGNTGSFMGPGWGAEFIVENNYFGAKSGKTIEWFDTSAAYPVKFYYSGNNQADSNTSWWGRASNPKPWLPAYQYTPDTNAGLPTSIPASAGPSLMFEK
jgi:pectate lyase